ncbi:MAG: translation initiation factor, partial [Bacteroidetes bacterium]
DRWVYSTRGLREEGPQEPETPLRQELRVERRRLAGGREVTLIKGFVGRRADLEALARQLRQACATGGSLTPEGILLQGNFVEKVIALLQAQGHKVKRSGG